MVSQYNAIPHTHTHIMKENNQPEESFVEKKLQEESARPLSFKSSFWLVFAIHLFGGIGLMSFTGGTKTANAEDKKFLASKEAQYTGIPEATPTPTPTPTPAPVEKKVEPAKSSQDNWPKAKEQKKITRPIYTKEYVVKSGDNLYSISKRYKLSFERLKEINHIKDPSKIVVGQHLKFL